SHRRRSNPFEPLHFLSPPSFSFLIQIRCGGDAVAERGRDRLARRGSVWRGQDRRRAGDVGFDARARSGHTAATMAARAPSRAGCGLPVEQDGRRRLVVGGDRIRARCGP
ncbi:unnamed protein product, partial [Urochloa humidicola]